MIRIAKAAIIAILLIFNQFSTVNADQGATIEASAVIETSGSSGSTANLEGYLQTYSGTTLADERKATSDLNGKFVFDGLNPDNSTTYILKVVYQQIDYYADPIVFNEGEMLKTVKVQLYDTTTSDNYISLDLSHVILSIASDSIGVKENYIFANSGDLTYTGTNLNGKQQTMRFSLPTDAISVSGSTGLQDNNIKAQNGEFFDSSPVTPKGSFVSYNYILPIKTDSRTLSWKCNYNTGRFDLLLENQTVKISSNRLAEQPPLAMGSKTYRDYSGIDFKKGEVIEVTISGLLPGKGTSNLAWAWLVLIPVAGILVGIIILKRRKSTAIAVNSEESSANADENKDEVMAEIAELDDSYENGDISEEEYKTTRKKLKQKLLEIVKESGQDEGN
jgi:hypothetical protein